MGRNKTMILLTSTIFSSAMLASGAISPAYASGKGEVAVESSNRENDISQQKAGAVNVNKNYSKASDNSSEIDSRAEYIFGNGEENVSISEASAQSSEEQHGYEEKREGTKHFNAESIKTPVNSKFLTKKDSRDEYYSDFKEYKQKTAKELNYEDVDSDNISSSFLDNSSEDGHESLPLLDHSNEEEEGNKVEIGANRRDLNDNKNNYQAKRQMSAINETAEDGSASSESQQVKISKDPLKALHQQNSGVMSSLAQNPEFTEAFENAINQAKRKGGKKGSGTNDDQGNNENYGQGGADENAAAGGSSEEGIGSGYGESGAESGGYGADNSGAAAGGDQPGEDSGGGADNQGSGGGDQPPEDRVGPEAGNEFEAGGAGVDDLKESDNISLQQIFKSSFEEDDLVSSIIGDRLSNTRRTAYANSNKNRGISAGNDANQYEPGIWIRGHITGGKRSRKSLESIISTTPAFSNTVKGGEIGADANMVDGLLLGGNFGIKQNNVTSTRKNTIDYSEDKKTATTTSYGGGVYGSYNFTDNIFLNSKLQGWKKHVNFKGATGQMNLDAYSFRFDLEPGYDYNFTDELTGTFQAGINYNLLRRNINDSESEVKDYQNSHKLKFKGLGEISYEMTVSDIGKASPYFYLGGEFPLLSSKYRALDESYEESEFDTSSGNIGIGVKFIKDDKFELNTGVRGKIGSNYNSATGMIKLRLNF